MELFDSIDQCYYGHPRKGLLASSTIDLSKIIVTNKNRIKLSSVGISDILEFKDDETNQDIKIRQLQDIQKWVKC